VRGLLVLWGGIGGALGLTVAGAVIVVRSGLRLSERVSRYQDLPMLKQIDEVQMKISRFEWRLSEISDVLERAQRALQSLRESREQVQGLGESINFAAKVAGAFFVGRQPKRES
jgi:hypothetical protein